MCQYSCCSNMRNMYWLHVRMFISHLTPFHLESLSDVIFCISHTHGPMPLLMLFLLPVVPFFYFSTWQGSHRVHFCITSVCQNVWYVTGVQVRNQFSEYLIEWKGLWYLPWEIMDHENTKEYSVKIKWFLFRIIIGRQVIFGKVGGRQLQVGETVGSKA